MESQGPPAGCGKPGCSFFSVQPPPGGIRGGPCHLLPAPTGDTATVTGTPADTHQGTEDTDSGFLSICVNGTVEVCSLRCENPLDSDRATPMPQNGAETSFPSCRKSLSSAQTKSSCCKIRLIHTVRKAVFSQGFPVRLGSHVQMRRDLVRQTHTHAGALVASLQASAGDAVVVLLPVQSGTPL